MDVRRRLSHLNSAIFNGKSIANVVRINLVRDETIPDPVSRFKIILDYRSGIIKQDDYIENSTLSNTVVNSFEFNHKESNITENVKQIYECDFNYFGLSSNIIKNADPRRSMVSIRLNNLQYEISNYLISESSIDEKEAKQNNMNSGYMKRHFKQILDIDCGITTLLIVYPNVASIPLFFGYNIKDPDINKLLSEEPDYIYSSFDEKFTYYDELSCITNSSTIVLDTNYYKAEAVLRTMEDETFEYEDMGNNTLIKYDSPYIIGQFNSDGSGANYYLKGNKRNYMLYSDELNCNNNQKKFLDYLMDLTPILIDSDAAKYALSLYKNLISNSEFCYPAYPLSDISIYTDDNPETYHIVTKDVMNSCIRIITLYDGEFAMIREFYTLQPRNSNDFSIVLVKLNHNKRAEVILRSSVQFDYEDNFVIMKYDIVRLGKYHSVNCILRENTEKKLEMGHICRKVEYHSPDIENFYMMEMVATKEHNINIITRFDSLLYSADNIDDIIVRNYLGLPVNYRYIKTV